MKKLIIIALSIFIFTGCNDKTLSKVYKTMSELDNYTVSINIDTKKESNKILVKNYKDESFEKNIDNNIYSLVNEEYYENNEPSKKNDQYLNTDAYFKPLKNAKSIHELKSEKIGDETYNVYEFISDKKIIDEIIKTTNLKKVNNKNIQTKAFVTNENQLYKIIYTFDEETTLQIIFTKLNETNEPRVEIKNDELHQ